MRSDLREGGALLGKPIIKGGRPMTNRSRWQKKSRGRVTMQGAVQVKSGKKKKGSKKKKGVNTGANTP